MISARRFKILLLVLGDIALFYLSLYITLSLRYPSHLLEGVWSIHQMPFFYIHLLWIIIFYVGGLYDLHIFSSFKKIVEYYIRAIIAAAGLAILIFYVMPTTLLITPKTNLLIDISILTPLLILWRKTFWNLAGKISKTKTLFFGSSKEVENMAKRLKLSPHLGYEPTIVLDLVDHNLNRLIKQHNIQLIVASKNIMQDENAAKRFYEALHLGVSIVNFENFYESLVEKIPVSIINEMWFLENLKEINKKFFEIFKRVFDIVFAILLGIPALLLFPPIALLSRIESSDNILVRQKRTGKNGKAFTLVKFRSMYYATEQDGKAKWAEAEDPRVTKVGKFLRKTRLDELPQLWNVLKADMSFIGPRPERPEFVKNLEKEIPHYAMRHLVKPGLSGWAQVKFSYGASVKDAVEKLQYDLYYVKNRSLVLDMAIAAKTLATILSRQGR